MRRFDGARILARLSAWIGGSFVWLGLMYLLITHQWTAYLSLGLAATVAFWGLARVLEARAGRRPPALRWQFIVVLFFIALQVIHWRARLFFRDPDRRTPPGVAVVAPADGFVVYVRRVRAGEAPLAIKNGRTIPLREIIRDPRLTVQEGLLIGIFMTPLSVHVNRAPVAGRIARRHYWPGSGLASMLPMGLRTMFSRRPFEREAEHLLSNERETLLIEGEFPIYLSRIADYYVKNISTWKNVGETVTQGERIGMIRMGSQTDLFFPASWSGRPIQPVVREGDYVYGGQTPLAVIGEKAL